MIRPILATARLTRLVTTDDVGEWWIKQPIDNAMAHYRQRHTYRTPVQMRGQTISPAALTFDEPWWWKYRDGLDCPHCVGFWIGVLTLAGEHTLGSDEAPRPVRAAWRFVTGALALNAVVAHVGALIGYWGDDDA